MLKPRRYVFVPVLLALALTLSACGGSTPTADPTIATAVAQTVAAQDAAQQEPASTASPEPAVRTTPLVFSPTLTPIATKIPPTLPTGTGANSGCLKANLVSETIPDGTILAPGEQFTKTWQIQNNSTCTWDSTYKIVFWDGDVMGGAYVYNFPQPASPGQTVDVPLVLIAPAVNGTYQSSWMLQAPDGTNFGVGQYSQPFYTEIVVSDAKKPAYGVLSVDYKITREPPSGCPANVLYTVYATITASGPVEVKYYWAQSDQNDSNPKTLKFEAAGSQTLSRQWQIHLGSSTGHDRWMQIVVLEPVYQEYETAVFSYTCK
ncbi:MAG: hypothetical protein HZB19_13900 [Chloroflexi bacterium]|nr:hypothetical protein [Chloroflexota bacterium]